MSTRVPQDLLTTSPEDYNPEDNFSVAMKLLEKIEARSHAKMSRSIWRPDHINI